ncbi:hypothetical protein [Salmonella enterica]|uniref:hypothetical protein n=1 Tax=Salmonella enterica TaxID=28901 RepID=UPI0009AD046E|nr:hypothetical protein [Salmonella enterica]
MADAASCLVPGPTGKQTEPFVRKRHVLDPYPCKRIGMGNVAHIRGIVPLFAFIIFIQVNTCQRRSAALSFISVISPPVLYKRQINYSNRYFVFALDGFCSPC